MNELRLKDLFLQYAEGDEDKEGFEAFREGYVCGRLDEQDAVLTHVKERRNLVLPEILGEY